MLSFEKRPLNIVYYFENTKAITIKGSFLFQKHATNKFNMKPYKNKLPIYAEHRFNLGRTKIALLVCPLNYMCLSICFVFKEGTTIFHNCGFYANAV